MERKITALLQKWKDSGDETALMVKGARQVGKTYIIDEFGTSNYDYYLKIDLRDERIDDDFWAGKQTELIQRITLRYPEFRVVKGKSLLFLDEIQDCPAAISALKALSKDRTLDVICSGSFLGLYEKSPKRYSVGYVHEITMHPMDFEEYLWALGLSHEQTESIGRHVRERKPFDPPVLHTIESYYRQYLIVGGMPLPVLKSVTSVNAGDYMDAQDDIINGYEQDILAYAEDAKDDVLKLLRLVPTELGKTNKRLRFKDIDNEENRGIREYREPIDWIEGSRFVTVCRRLSAIERPLRRNSRESMLKMYMVDTGLLVRMYGGGTVEAMMRKDLSINEGAIGENSVCQMLTACGIYPFYYEVDKEVEVDFIAEIGSEIFAIEVKTGKKRRARSLKKMMEMDAGRNISRWVKFEYGNIMMTEDGVEHYPLFCAAFAGLLTSEAEVHLTRGDHNLVI